MKKHTHSNAAKASNIATATFRRLNLGAACILLIATLSSAVAQENAPAAFPSFRHVDLTSVAAEPSLGGTLILLADQDFAPWSFMGADGRFQGIAVDLAQSTCLEAGLTCEIKPTEFVNLVAGLEREEAAGLVSGPKIDEALAIKFALTRPYFQTLGRFVVRNGSSLSTPDIRSLAGRRIGFHVNSAHARFLETHYSRSAITPFEDHSTMLEALRTGQVDAVFGDAVQLSFWLRGSASKGCCMYLGKAFVDRASFTRSLSFVLSRKDPRLRVRFDDALDRLESKGEIATIFSRYVPASVW